MKTDESTQLYQVKKKKSLLFYQLVGRSVCSGYIHLAAVEIKNKLDAGGGLLEVFETLGLEESGKCSPFLDLCWFKMQFQTGHYVRGCKSPSHCTPGAGGGAKRQLTSRSGEWFWPARPPLPLHGSVMEPGVAWGGAERSTGVAKQWRGGPLPSLSLGGRLAGSATGRKMMSLAHGTHRALAGGLWGVWLWAPRKEAVIFLITIFHGLPTPLGGGGYFTSGPMNLM